MLLLAQTPTTRLSGPRGVWWPFQPGVPRAPRLVQVFVTPQDARNADFRARTLGAVSGRLGNALDALIEPLAKARAPIGLLKGPHNGRHRYASPNVTSELLPCRECCIQVAW